jgi:hypothetical protein
MRRRMRLRTTAPPRAFLTLMPKRLMRSGSAALFPDASRGVAPRRTRLRIRRVSTGARHEENPAAVRPNL